MKNIYASRRVHDAIGIGDKRQITAERGADHEGIRHAARRSVVGIEYKNACKNKSET
jgi:hypothetical protein